MSKFLLILLLVFPALRSISQNIDGLYVALELNSLNVDSAGNVTFYMDKRFPKEKWFHEIRVTIKGKAITIEKYPVVIDSQFHKEYSASDGGFLTYRGTLVKVNRVWIASVNLVECNYIGFSPFVPPIIVENSEVDSVPTESESTRTHDLSKYEVFQPKFGPKVYLPKGTIQKDIVLRKSREGLWINNTIFYKKYN